MKFYGGRRNAAYLRKQHKKRAMGAAQRGLLGVLASAALLAAAWTALYKTAVRPVPIRAAQAGPEQETAPAAHADAAQNTPRRAQAPACRKQGVYNILLCGMDADGLRTDTIMIAHLDEHTGKTALVSVPRDTPVEAEDGSLMKLNAVYAGGGAGGMARLQKRLAALTGFETDGYVLIDMDAFEAAVDLLGGVEFDVPQDMDYTDPAQGLEIHLRAGRQLLGGEQAMQLVRYRKGYAMQDIRRTEVQQEFLRALARRCLSPQNIGRLPELLSIMRQSVTTDLSLGNFLYFAQALHTCGVSELFCCTLAGEGVTVNGVSYYPLYEGRLLETVNAHLNPYDTPRRSADVRVITPQRVGTYQKPETKQKQTPPEKAPARTEIQPMPNDPALWS